MSYRFLEHEKQFYKGFEEVNGNFISLGNIFFDGADLFIRFRCLKCNWVIKSEKISFSNPITKECGVSGEELYCEKCNEIYEVELHLSAYETLIQVPSLPKEWKFFFKIIDTFSNSQNELL